MNFTSLNKELNKLFNKATADQIFPGAAAGISFGPLSDRKKFIFCHGNLYYPNLSSYDQFPSIQKPVDQDIFFDLASLTKPFATLLAILCLIKAGKVKLTDRLPELLNCDAPSSLRSINLAQLLSHSSGLPAHRPYYIKLMDIPEEKRASLLKTWILQEKLDHPPGTITVYSDLGYMLLGWIIEQQSGSKLDVFVNDTVLAPLDLTDHIHFNSNNQPDPQIYAPTEKCLWRKRTLTGQVHDDNCFALSGMAGHAGLFGNINGVMNLATHLLDTWHDKTSHPNYHSTDLKKAIRQQQSGSTWVMGFDTPSPTNSSSGKFLSPQSFGHLGFTGTSFWIDPTIDLVIVLLTNRVHPDRDNDSIRKFRPLFHDTILQWLNKNNDKGCLNTEASR